MVVLDVAGAALRDRGDRLERRGALELGEDRVVGTAQVVGQHVEASAVGHADDDLARAAGGGQLDQLVEHRDGHVESLDRELLLAQVGLVHEALERVDLGQAPQQRLLLVGGERGAEATRLDRLAQPQPLAVRRDVLDLVGDRTAVGLAQVRQRVGQRLTLATYMRRIRAGIRSMSSGVRPSGSGSSAGSPSGSRPSGSRRGGEMPVGAMRLEQRGGRLHRLQELLVGAQRPGRERRRARVPRRGDRGSGRSRRCGRRHDGVRAGRATPEVGEHALVEALLALEQRLDPLKEAAGLGALDDPVVVGRGHGHDLLGPDRLADRAQARRVTDRAGGDDRALPDHQPRDRGDRADPAGVGQRQVGAGQVVGGERVGARLLDQRVVGVEEAREVLAARRRG